MPTYIIEPDSLHDHFQRSRTKVQIVGGGFGNGKTSTACIKAIRLAYDYPGSNGLIARETYPKLNDTIRKEFFKWLPTSSIERMPTKDDNTLTLTNNTTVNFRYIAQRGKQSIEGITTSNLLSATYDWIVIDQIEDPQIRYKDFLDLLGRLRGPTPYKGDDETMPMSGPRWMIITCNPTANWFYKKIVRPYTHYKETGIITDDLLYDHETGECLISLFEGPTDANKQLDPDYVRGLKAAYKGAMFDRFFMGKWGAYEGLVYPSYDRKHHVIPQSVMIQMMRKAAEDGSPFTAIEGYDPGMAVPSCYLIGFVDYFGRVFIVDGFYQPGADPYRVAEVMTTLRAKYGNWLTFTESIWTDPQAFKKTVINNIGKGATTLARLMHDYTGFYFKPGQNDITSGIPKVAQYLALVDNNHYSDPTLKGPNLLFADTLDFIDTEITAYYWSTDPQGERVDKPRDGNDHAMDTIKYMLSRLPDPSTLLTLKPPKQKPRHLTEWMEVA